MNRNRLPSPRHASIRAVLRIGGPIVALAGLIFLIVGFGSFFAAFGSFQPPRYFWCAFVGIPLLFVGLLMCKLGYLADFYRYVAAETTPVAADVANTLGEETRPGVRAAARAVTEGVLEAQQQHQEAQEPSRRNEEAA